MVLLFCALWAPSAGASTIGVYDDSNAAAVALAGPDVVVLRQTSSARSSLVAVPRLGGKPMSVLRVRNMNWLFERDVRRLAASAERVALIAEIVDRNGGTVQWRVYSGPPLGPIRVVRTLAPRDQWQPVSVDVDGDRALLVETRLENDGPLRAFVLDSASGLVPLAWASAAAAPVELSGGFVAAAMAGPNRVGVLDLATGAELATIPLDERERSSDLSLAPDGRVAVATRAGVWLGGPGLAPRLLPGTKGLARIHLTGTTLFGTDKTGRAVSVATDGGKLTPVGPPTTVLVSTAGDATSHGWIANGCARVATVPAFAVPPAMEDPCATTEIAYAYIASTKLRGRTIDVPVGCVAAPRGVCRGVAIARIFEGDGKAAASGRFAIPVGKSRNVKLRVTPAALAVFRREGYGNLVMDARIANGRIGAGADGAAELSVSVPGRD